MKCYLFFILWLSLLLSCEVAYSNYPPVNQKSNEVEQSSSNSINIRSSLEIYSLAKDLASGYEKTNTSVKIKIEDFNPLSHSVENKIIYFLPEENFISGKDSLWKMVIGRNAIVPVINANNPLLEKILLKGISSRTFQQLLTEKSQNWRTILNEEQNYPVHLFITDNEAVIAKVANFSQLDPNLIKEKMTVEKNSVLSSVQKDIYAIGFCKLTDVLTSSANQFMDGIKLLPVDKNKNDRIDSFENIYSNPETFTRGVWIGKYPGVLCGNIYAVASTKPTDRNTLDFLTWIQSEGQQFLNSSGFSILASSERNSNIEELNRYQLLAKDEHWVGTWLYILILAIAIFAGFLLYRIILKKKALISGDKLVISPAMNEKSLIAPKGLYFDKSHTWAFMEKEGMVKIGIDDFLQHVTGELTRVTLKESGEMIRKGEKIFTISHNGKKLDIHAPISGIIRERNRNLLIDSTLLNVSPYNEGWVYVIEPKNWLKEIRFLFMVEKYSEWVEDEITRLKDFFAVNLKSHDLGYSHIILQDGGEMSDNVLADLDPEVWEDFQAKFIDTSK